MTLASLGGRLVVVRRRGVWVWQVGAAHGEASTFAAAVKAACREVAS